jgi:malonyl-CoA/methylmalonyl-CoA synthetase
MPAHARPRRRAHNLYQILESGFPSEGDACAIEAEDRDGRALYYTWDDLRSSSAKLAHLLRSLGLRRGDRVAVHTDKSVEALLLYLAVLRAGLVYLPLNPAYQQQELRYFIGDAEPALVVCSSAHADWVGELARDAGVAHVLTLDGERRGSLLERAAGMPEQFDTVAVAADDLAAILYTSGTTGRSKGAMLSHANLASNARVLQSYWHWQPGDVLLHVLPIFHVHGLFVASHGALINGSKMIWLDRFDARRVVAELPRCTVFMGVPTLYVRLLAEPAFGRQACAGMRLFISGSAPLLIETFRAFEQRCGHTILERYGMSETLMLTSNPYSGERRGGTVGIPLPGVGLRITDGEGRVLPAGEVGNIEVKGPNVFSGYWRMPEKTAQEFTADGYFKTGDVGRIDADGYVTIVGRSKDLIISGGFNVYPAEIEGFVNEIDGVEESAVIGVPHPDFGEAVVAVVIPKPGARLQGERIIGVLKRRIANFKVPKRVVVAASLPRNAMGKVQKNVLREQHRGLFA